MAIDRRLSEVAVAYNINIACLDEARQIFEKEVKQLNEVVMDHLYAATKRLNQDEKMGRKLRWQQPEDDSRNREGPWLNFAARAVIGLDVKVPGAKVFKKNAAYLYFETVYDRDAEKKFVFQCRFENQNIVSDELDEKVLELVRDKSDQFPAQVHFKANTTVLFRFRLEENLFDELNEHIDSAMAVCQDEVNILFPDSAYNQSDAVEEKLAG